MKIASVYNVLKLKQSMKIDGNWLKQQWQNIDAVDITNYIGTIPEFRPAVKAKMTYDDENLYVIFRVQDRYVRCITKDFNGPVWEDSCVEFFFRRIMICLKNIQKSLIRNPELTGELISIKLQKIVPILTI